MIAARTVIFPITGPEEWLKRLVHDTDSQRRVNRADEVADTPDDDRHEAIHDITLAKTRPDVAEL